MKTFFKIIVLSLLVFAISGCLATLQQEPQELISEVQDDENENPMVDKLLDEKTEVQEVQEEKISQEKPRNFKLPLFFQPKLQAVFREYEKFAFRDVKGLKINIEYLETEDLQKKCAQVTNLLSTTGQIFLGCAQTLRHFKNGEETNLCTIWTMKVTTFNDKALVQVLGHELLHCIGASHE